MDRNVTEAVLTWAEMHPALEGLHVFYEYLPNNESAAMIGTLSGNPVVKYYIDGSYLGAYRFQVILRQITDDTMAKLDAMERLRQVVDAIEIGYIPVLPESYQTYDLEVDTLPSKVATEPDNKTEDYQVTFTLSYKKGAK